MREKHIKIRRTAAIGDVIQTLRIAEELYNEGYTIDFFTSEGCIPFVEVCPYINNVVIDEGQNVDVDFNNVYEVNNLHPCIDLWVEKVWESIKARISISDCRSNLHIPEWIDDECVNILEGYDSPWIFINKGSISDITRRLDSNVLQELINKCNVGTVFNIYPNQEFNNCVNLPSMDLLQHFGLIKNCDVLLTPVTGPLHVGYAFKKRIITLNQSNIISKVFPHNDFSVIGDHLDCHGCLSWDNCKIDKSTSKPKCSVFNIQKAIHIIYNL